MSISRLRGRWHDFRIQAVWSAKDNGVIKVWLNNRLAHQHTGRNLNRNVAPSFKFGVYQTGLQNEKGKIPTQVVYFDEVKRGTSEQSVALR